MCNVSIRHQQWLCGEDLPPLPTQIPRRKTTRAVGWNDSSSTTSFKTEGHLFHYKCIFLILPVLVCPIYIYAPVGHNETNTSVSSTSLILVELKASCLAGLQQNTQYQRSQRLLSNNYLKIILMNNAVNVLDELS